MIPVITVPNVHYQPPLQTEFVVGVPTEVSPFTRLAHYAVPSSGNSTQIYNNTRGGSGYAPSRAQLAASQAQTQPSGNIALFQVPAGAALGPAFNFTSQFMAQVIGQGGVANDNGLVEAFYQSAQQTPTVEEHPYSLNYLLGAANKTKPVSTHIGAELITTPNYQPPATKSKTTIDNYSATFTRNRLFLEEKDRVVNAVTL